MARNQFFIKFSFNIQGMLYGESVCREGMYWEGVCGEGVYREGVCVCVGKVCVGCV